MMEEGSAGASKFGQECNEKLQQIVAIVRTQISALDRCTLEAMIVLDVHNRDTMINLGTVQNLKITDFDW
jgi:dynein heavy chain